MKTPKLRLFLKPLTTSELEEKSKKYITQHAKTAGPFLCSKIGRNERLIYFPEDILESDHPLDTLQKCLIAFLFQGTVSKNGQPLSPKLL